MILYDIILYYLVWIGVESSSGWNSYLKSLKIDSKEKKSNLTGSESSVWLVLRLGYCVAIIGPSLMEVISLVIIYSFGITMRGVIQMIALWMGFFFKENPKRICCIDNSFDIFSEVFLFRFWFSSMYWWKAQINESEHMQCTPHAWLIPISSDCTPTTTSVSKLTPNYMVGDDDFAFITNVYSYGFSIIIWYPMIKAFLTKIFLFFLSQQS